MAKLLWTIDDVKGFIHHPDFTVRRWALDRLTHLFPNQAGEPLAAMLDDPTLYVGLRAAEFLSKTGEDQRYGPILLEHLRKARGHRFGYLAEALARLNYQEALPLILDRLSQGEQDPLDTNEFLRIVLALGMLGGNQARQVLWQILDETADTHLWASAVMGALLDAALPQDVERLVQSYRVWRLDSVSRREIEAFASPVGATRLVQEIGYALKNGFDATVERATRWLGSEPLLSEGCAAGLTQAFQRQHRRVFDVALGEARRILTERGDDLA